MTMQSTTSGAEIRLERGTATHAAHTAFRPADLASREGRRIAYIELSDASRERLQRSPEARDLELICLRKTAKVFDGATPAKQLDPATVVASRWAARAPRSFESPEFQRLVDEISSAGGNVQPIVVRRCGADTFEIACGHRRHRACHLLGLPVLAVVRDLSDQELFAVMHRENKERTSLSPWEQGLAYQQALGEGLFSSRRGLALSVGASHTWINKCLQVATLPKEVLGAFRTPAEVQPGHASKLAAACEVNQEGVIAVARRLRDQQRVTRMTPNEVVDRLTSVPGQTPKSVGLFLSGMKVGTSERDSSGHFTVSLSAKNFDERAWIKVTAALQSALREVETEFPPMRATS